MNMKHGCFLVKKKKKRGNEKKKNKHLHVCVNTWEVKNGSTNSAHCFN